MAVILKNGDIFSGCKILSRCGKGSFGVTYLARNPIGKTVVIKVVSASCPERELAGLRNYMQISGTHDNLLQIFHVGEMEEGFYYTMEAADNCSETEDYLPATLGNILRQGKRFSPEEAVRITRELLTGIAVIHDANLIHRDIKPDNIIFVNGIAKLSDPGLVIQDGEEASFAGTPGFIPPEMIIDAAPANKQSDLYAIGKVFYCMLTGNAPTLYPIFPDNMSISLRRQFFPIMSQMCAQAKNKRFKSAEEFIAALPEKISAPTRLEQLYTEFRDWQILNREKYRFCLSMFLSIIFIAALIFGWMKISDFRRQQTLTNARNSAAALLRINHERREALMLQIETEAPELLTGLRSVDSAIAAAKKENATDEILKYAQQRHRLLVRAAKKRLQQLPIKKYASFKEGFTISGAAHSFLSSPLSEYLSPSEIEDYNSRLNRFDSELYSDWSGPRCGQLWSIQGADSYPMVFVPAGAVRLKHNKKLYKIPYHFWVCQNEVSHQHFSFMTGISPQKSSDKGTPVERICWNDMLTYCYLLTNIMRQDGRLPPGYIVRPPNEAEWEFVARNAYQGADTTTLAERAVIKSNSDNRTWPAGKKQASKLGVFDIYGNVAEIVKPMEKTVIPDAVIVRGGSFRTNEKGCFKRFEYLPYQNIPFDIGFRVVLAPGDMDYFDRNFYLRSAAQVTYDGRVYELIGGNIFNTTWEDARLLCRMPGGKLAEFENKKQLDFIAKKIPLAAGSWGCFIGGEKVNGKWLWAESKRPIDFGIWSKSARNIPDARYLLLRGKRWTPSKHFRSGIMLCQWDEKTYPMRNAQLKTVKKFPLELTRFAVGERKFMLIKTVMSGSAAHRFCELLGGRLACPDSPELYAAVVKKLHNFRNRKILLGGYAKRNQWFWVSGKQIPPPLPKDVQQHIPTLNINYTLLHNGQLYDGKLCDSILCEWPGGSDISI